MAHTGTTNSKPFDNLCRIENKRTEQKAMAQTNTRGTTAYNNNLVCVKGWQFGTGFKSPQPIAAAYGNI